MFNITLSLIAFSLTPKNVTLNDLKWPFCVKFCFAPVCLELWSLAFEACLLLNFSECGQENFKPKRTAAASRSFLATVRLSSLHLECINMKTCELLVDNDHDKKLLTYLFL